MLQTTLAQTLSIAIESVCPLALSALFIGFCSAVVAAFRKAIPQMKRLHSVPCNYCVYFTGCHYLKCTVHPSKALTEEAVDCRDFEHLSYRKSCCTKGCKS
ncbi:MULTISPECIES: hypothetical protein [unclassified Roseofilum]|uniref:hypothetical protein n=1 Tax=unclassified Roseofilum TaxID=2620099 RepID=UPI00298E594E|nr:MULTISPECIES: hypothetical protein [unclassified Roseofilum]